jgi:hypothetical protein
MLQTAFQANAFQNNAFQISGVPPTPSTIDTHDGFTQEEIRRARNLDRKIRERQQALLKSQADSKIRRKQQLKDLIDPPKIVAKQKQNKLQSIQEVKAVAYRQEVARLQTELVILEAKRLAELDDEESVLLLI